ncbi:septal ring lytic transglycosylase RlpA family protein [Luteimonas sp. RIT-PG2_3]
MLSLLAACGSQPRKSEAPASAGPPASAPARHGHTPARGTPRVSPYAPAQEDLSKRGDYVAGGLYAPGVKDSVPSYIPDVDAIPEPEVVQLPRSAYGNRSPYQVLGRSYHVLDDHADFVETGTASYYGSKFHGRRTSNQEVYDMYAFTAAHKSLPLPSFARVTNLDNGKSVIVRVNDRGPFHEGRVVDLSYAAAVKLGIHQRGTGRVEVRALHPGDAGAMPQVAAAAAPSTPSGMDGLVRSLPAQAPAAATPTLQAAALAAAPAAAASTRVADQPGYGSEENRFRLVQDGRVRSADEFDTWMKARRDRYDAYQQAHGNGAAPTATAPAAAKPIPAAAVATRAAPAALPSGQGGLQLQVGVFSVRANAERALAQLQAAGIAAASLHDGMSGGKPVWRLRVGPVASHAVAELSSRVAGLGLGTPQIVRE